MFYSMSMVLLHSMLHHFNYPALKYYIYSHFSFHLNLLAVCNCNSLFILIEVLLLRRCVKCYIAMLMKYAC